MGKDSKLREKILSGGTDNNIDFSALCKLLKRLDFNEKINGSHHIFTRIGIDDIVNIQPKGNKARPYQVKQIRGILVKYQLGASDVD